MSTSTWKETTTHIESRQITGTLNLDATIAASAVVDATTNSDFTAQGLVTITTTDAHGFLGGHVYINGTTNYDGMREISSVTTSGITFKVNKYVAETPGGTETVGFTVDPATDFVLLEINLHLSSAASTSENFTCTLDANAGSAYDYVVFSQDVNTYADINFSGERYFENGDKLVFALPNTDGLTYGLDVKYRRIR